MKEQNSLRPGSTILLLGTHHDPDKRHMCIVLTDPEQAAGRQVLYVPIITAREKSDKTCVLEVGDHKFIRHTSCVHYAMMGQRAEAHLLKVGELSQPLQPDVLERVLEGAKNSPHSAPWAKRLLLGG